MRLTGLANQRVEDGPVWPRLCQHESAYERAGAAGALQENQEQHNPVLTWIADNLVARVDPAGNVKPDKEKSREKIDGVVSLIMALDLALRHPEKKSVYEKQGLMMLKT